MYVTRIPNRDSPPAVLLRESSRGRQGEVAHVGQHLRLAGSQDRQPAPGAGRGDPGSGRAERFEIERALAHGHVAAALGAVRRLGLDKALPSRPER